MKETILKKTVSAAIGNKAIRSMLISMINKDTVYEVYSSGRTIGDALQAPLFKNGRAWQKEYGYCNRDKENILLPCSIKDHFENFKSNILSTTAKPENEEAIQMLADPEIEKALIRMEDELRQLTEKIWEEEFLQLDPASEA